MRGRVSALLVPLLFLLGVSVLLYPTISDRWNRITQSRAIVDYGTSVSTMKPTDVTPVFSSAAAYNKALETVQFPFMHAERIEGYENLLSVDGTDVMGVVSIPKIGVELPIYHGTSESVLNVGVGHLEGSSLPIGGSNTHTVLSAHRGLPSAKLFTDLDRMEIGDMFTVTVLDRTMHYEVETCTVVLPEDVSALSIQAGRDLCTLMTCTPYGINTHRLLVQGVRKHVPVMAAEAVSAPIKRAKTSLLPAPLVACILMLPMLSVLCLMWLFHRGVRSLRNRSSREYISISSM